VKSLLICGAHPDREAFFPGTMSEYVRQNVARSRFVLDALPAAGDPRWCPETGEPVCVQRLLWKPPLQPSRLAPGTKLAQHHRIDFLIDTSGCTDIKADHATAQM
jgi:hypothetical protein